jgi:hypothetical protein
VWNSAETVGKGQGYNRLVETAIMKREKIK